MSDIKGRIFSVEEFTVFDGPGIRTSVFLKGCPLHCSWCHSPEGQSSYPQFLKNPNGCLGRGACTDIALKKTGKKELTAESAEVCPRGLIRLAGEEVTPDDIFDRIIKNEQFYVSSGGGVTFSGGEPLMQADFLIECLDLFEGRIHRCVQTSGHCPSDKFKAVAERTDLFLYDIKLVNSEKMHRYTGGDSKLIINNLQHLVNTEKDFIIRIPLIPGVTDTDENISDIISLLKNLDIEYAEAMPYNSMAGAKYPLAGKAFTPDYDHNAKVKIPSEAFEKNGIRLRIL